MAILDEMQLLVTNLEAAFSRRVEAERERQETAARDVRERATGVRELRVSAAEDARERLEEVSKRLGEVADMMDGFFRDRTTQAVSDARDRAKAESERRAEAAEEARSRLAELDELRAMWRDHSAAMASLATGGPRPPERKGR